jgi:hypothetical protein
MKRFMDDKTIVITEKDGQYEVENHGISDFALIGILECLLFALKSTNSKELSVRQVNPRIEPKKANEEPNKANIQESKVSELRTRISNAIKAIRELGGNLEETDLDKLTDEELQAELNELTNQYKRLKNAKGNK